MVNNNHEKRFRLSIRTRIAQGMIISAILVLPVTIIALCYNGQMNSLATVIAEKDTELLRIGNTVIHNFLEVRNSERNFLIYNDTFYLSAARSRLVHIILLGERARRLDSTLAPTFDSLINSLLIYRRLLDSLFLLRPFLQKNSGRDEVRRLQETHRRLINQLETVIDPRLKDSLLTVASLTAQEMERLELTGVINRLFTQRMNETALSIVASGEKIMAYANQKITEHKLRISRLFSLSQRNIIPAIIILTALLILFVIRLPRALVLPIKRINNALIRAEQGDLNVRVAIQANDELGALARQINRTFANLQVLDELKTNSIYELDRRFKLLAKNINEGVIVFDREPRVIYANPAVEPLLGVVASECINHNIKELPNLNFLIPRLEQILSGTTSHQECEVLPEIPGSALCFETLRDRNRTITGALVIITQPASSGKTEDEQQT
ncbi:MAG: HAMP domain-containing protein [bacterium]